MSPRTHRRTEQTHLPAMVGPLRRASFALAAIIAAACALTLTAAPAYAARVYESHISGLKEPTGITIDTSDNVWVIEHGNGGLISEYNSFPSQTKIGQQTGQGKFACTAYCEDIAVNSANGSLYVSGFSGTATEFDAAGEFVPPQWDLEGSGFGSNPLVVDNSGAETNGRIYRDLNTFHVPRRIGDHSIDAFNTEREPVDYTASKSYINGSWIESPPGQEFLEVTSLAVDSQGNIYAGDYYHEAVYEFRSSGEFVREFTGAATPNHTLGNLTGTDSIGIDPTNGNVLIVSQSQDAIYEFSSAGGYLGEIKEANGKPFGAIGGIDINSEGRLYVTDTQTGVVDIFAPTLIVPKVTYEEPSGTSATGGTLNATISPNGGGEVTTCTFEYGASTASLTTVPCTPDPAATHFSTPTNVSLSLTGLSTNTKYYYRISSGNASGSWSDRFQSFIPRSVQDLQSGGSTEVTNEAATLHGSFLGNGEDTHYTFEYGTDTNYGSSTPSADAGSGSGPQNVAPVTIGDLQPATVYHYRIVASNGGGTSYGEDHTFKTLTRPSVTGLYSSNLSATTADLHAKVNPQGGDTHYYFEYGVTTAYGSYAPLAPPGEDIGSGEEPVSVEAHLSNLEKGVTYHFRVVAESRYGTGASEDQSFNFYPPSCPNAHLRQITHSSYLPDCRAYELVSPEETDGTVIYPEGPNSPTANSPSRVAFGGILGVVPGSGDPIDNLGDLYVATRTNEGWKSKYVGIPGSEALEADGPPNDPNSIYGGILGILTSPAGERTDANMDKFLDWNEGDRGFSGPQPGPDWAPYVWSATGELLGEFPNAPGYSAGPVFETSADFSHYVFESLAMTIVDNNTETDEAATVSVMPGGELIPPEPGDTEPNYESLRVPAVSTNGSHILMLVRGESEELCEEVEGGVHEKCPLQPGHLYMRVGDAITYDISGEGHEVRYVGMTPDGSKVYFTSEEQLTSEDHDHSTDLYMWSEEKAAHNEPALTLISKGDNSGIEGEPGNTDACHASWTRGCGIVPFENNGYLQYEQEGSAMGNGLSDNSIAAANGDIYFFSPERLVGSKGVNGQENLYDYREDTLQYVTTVPPQPFCEENSEAIFGSYCSAGPIVRMQVTPNDSRMAFLTPYNVTSYISNGHLEMYIFDPASGEVTCVSCLASGEPPTSNVRASSDGLFMTNDGRVFFSTGDSLVPEDTDGLYDTYEYTEGHAQLISSGSSSKDSNSGLLLGLNAELFQAGLMGVSANGADVYFTTYDTLVGQDRNGTALKIYDARTDGGFPYSPPPPPCEAADECHGAGSSQEAPFAVGSGGELGSGGNVTQTSGSGSSRPKRHKRKHHAKTRHQTRRRRLRAPPLGRGADR